MGLHEAVDLIWQVLGLVFVIMIVIVAIKVVLSVDPSKIVTTLLTELAQARSRRKVAGSANIYALLAIFIFGIFMVVGEWATNIFGMVSERVLSNSDIAHGNGHWSLSEYIGPDMYFLALLFFAIFSVVVISGLEK
jgi:hypothetical protein